MTDAQAWLTPYLTAPSLSEPTRPDALPEQLKPGQLDDCGRIITAHGGRVGNGYVWIEHVNLAAARYYGWQHAGRYGTLNDGATVVQVCRS